MEVKIYYTMCNNIPLLSVQFCYNSYYLFFHCSNQLGYMHISGTTTCNLYYDYLLIYFQNNTSSHLLSKKTDIVNKTLIAKKKIKITFTYFSHLLIIKGKCNLLI